MTVSLSQTNGRKMEPQFTDAQQKCACVTALSTFVRSLRGHYVVLEEKFKIRIVLFRIVMVP